MGLTPLRECFATGDEVSFRDDIKGEPGAFFGFGGEEFAGEVEALRLQLGEWWKCRLSMGLPQWAEKCDNKIIAQCRNILVWMLAMVDEEQLVLERSYGA